MRNYLNTIDFRDELDSNVRFLQNCLAANLAIKGGFEHKLVIPVEVTRWFANFSRLCGLEVISRDYDEPTKLYSFQIKFTVDEYTLGELYISHLSLRLEYHRHERRKWFIQGMSQLATVKFYGRKIVSHTGMPEYFRAARQVSKKLRSGEISLPPMLD